MLKLDKVPTPLLRPDELSRRTWPIPGPSSWWSRPPWVLWRFLVLAVQLVAVRLVGRSTPELRGRLARVAAERLGGYWPRAAWILSSRSDMFSIAFCQELRAVDEGGPPIDVYAVERVLQRDLGNIDEIFERFDAAPVSSTHNAQVHRARLREGGVEVQVTVLHPDARRLFLLDVALLRVFLGVLARVQPGHQWRETVFELRSQAHRDLDLRIEASHARRLRKALGRQRQAHVPRVFQRRCSANILVTEHVAGVPMSQYLHVLHTDLDRLGRWLEENDIDPVVLAQRLYLSHCQQLFEANLFHGDLRPSNILLLRGSQFAMTDFRKVGTAEAAFKKRYDLLHHALASFDWEKVADMMLVVTPTLPVTDTKPVRDALVRVLRLWEVKAYTRGVPYRDKSLARVISDLSETLSSYGVSPSWELMKLNAGYAAMDDSLTWLAPKLNYMRMSRNYWRKAERRQAAGLSQPELAGRAFGELARVVTSSPDAVHDILYFHSEHVRKRARTFQVQGSGFAGSMQLVASRVAQLAAAAFSILVVVLLHQHAGHQGCSVLPERVHGALDLAPVLQQGTWVAMLVAVGLVTWTAWGARGIFLDVGPRRDEPGLEDD